MVGARDGGVLLTPSLLKVEWLVLVGVSGARVAGLSSHPCPMGSKGAVATAVRAPGERVAASKTCNDAGDSIMAPTLLRLRLLRLLLLLVMAGDDAFSLP